MKKYTNADLRDLIQATNIEDVILDNIDIDSIGDKEVKKICRDLKELMTELYDLLESSEFDIVEDEDEDEDYENDEVLDDEDD